MGIYILRLHDHLGGLERCVYPRSLGGWTWREDNRGVARDFMAGSASGESRLTFLDHHWHFSPRCTASLSPIRAGYKSLYVAVLLFVFC